MQITKLRTNHLDRPLGFGFDKAILSWLTTDTLAARQAASRVEVSLTADESSTVYDSDRVKTVYAPDSLRIVSGMDSAGWALPLTLQPMTRYFWRVTVWSDLGEEAVSEWTWFETPRSNGAPWKAEWITSPFGREAHPVFSRRFVLAEKPVSVRCYIAGLGMYEARLNGEKLGDEVLLPGFHAYDSYLMYQTLELEPRAGENVMEVTLGEGWYMGRYGLKSRAPRYGEEYLLLAEIRLKYADGREEVIGTDENWQVVRSPITFDSIYDGETYDAALKPGQPQSALYAKAPEVSLIARINPPLRKHERFTPVLSPENPQVLDMGQNFAGWCRFYCDAPAGTEIRLLYAEYMKDGDVYRDNLRKAKCVYTYISDGTPRWVEPRFTYFGFRYVKVEGWPGALDPASFTGCAVYSSLERTGFIETSDVQLNRLYENTLWSLKSNFVDIPTDCPQRDERMGWTGDIQIFADTASYHMDTAAFLDKFMLDLMCEQKRLDGSVPCVVPMCRYELNGVSAWGDAACVIPWRLYEHYGDREMLSRHFDSMRGWVDWISRQNDRHASGFLWDGCAQLGDWLSLDGDSVYGGTDRTFVATAYYYYSALLTSRAASVLGLDEEEERYRRLAQSIREAFGNEYFTRTGSISIRTQTACVMALYLDLAPENAKAKTARLLVRLVRENGVQLRTGFVGTPWLLPVLSDIGETQLAYDLLFKQEYPGWMYEVNRGATTIWERWNSIEPDGEMNRDGMNSFNHYAYGSVAGWLYGYAAGIRQPEDRAPSHGMRSICVSPRPDRRIRHFCCRYAAPAGEYEVRWDWQGIECTVRVKVPFGCEAQIALPDGRTQQAASGEYSFTLSLPLPKYTLDAQLDALLSDPAARDAIARLFPQAIRGVAFQYEMHTLRQLLSSPFSEMSDEQIRALEEELSAIEYEPKR